MHNAPFVVRGENIPLALVRFDLRKAEEWQAFCALFTAYLAEVCTPEEYAGEVRDLHDPALREDLLLQTLRKKKTYFVMRVVTDTQEQIGLVSYSCKEKTRRGFLNNLYIAPAHRGRGTGRTVLALAEEHLRGLGVTRLELVPVEHAVGFYERAGYTPARVTEEGERVFWKGL